MIHSSAQYLTLSLLYVSGLGFQISHQCWSLNLRSLRTATADDDDQPLTLDWNTLSTTKRSDEPQDFVTIENEDEDDNSGNVFIPPGGYSVSDQIDDSQRERFAAELVPMEGLSGVAALLTTSIARGAFEPIRYLIATTPPANVTERIDDSSKATTKRKPSKPSPTEQVDYVLIDVPPYSPQLVSRIKEFMGTSGTLKSILITSRDNIHYDDMPGVFVARRSDLNAWTSAFPGMTTVSYRLDTPRDCRPFVTQVLDGYGPFAMLENGTFIETGRPLTYNEWDFETTERVMNGKQAIPNVSEEELKAQADEYTIESIRRKEQGKQVIAVYTPGHTYGSVSYVFPHQFIVASGFTIPVEDDRVDENLGDASTGPALDCRGYISTSKAGMQKQMESARKLIDEYIDRFKFVLPSRGNPLFLQNDLETRRTYMNEIVDQYDRIGQIYEQLGILGAPDDE
ncbi:hypothetical protein MPSEU_000303400 [Mayamaea pseudoterrestris]|nr:hypothetical protein MPSEU_000303400 [Mayamaea pseudoterrestris]